MCRTKPAGAVVYNKRSAHLSVFLCVRSLPGWLARAGLAGPTLVTAQMRMRMPCSGDGRPGRAALLESLNAFFAVIVAEARMRQPSSSRRTYGMARM